MEMNYTTINKLKKDGIIKDSDLIGKMLTSEKAKDLYKTNIRVHHKHYIPKDKRKYFHDEEMAGGRINIGKAFKKFGSMTKHTFENLGNKTIKGINKGAEAIKDFGEHAVDKIEEYGDVVLHGRNDYPPKVRDLIKKYGNKRIKKITIDRTPVPDVLTGALNAVSFGAFGKRFGRLPYDELFHLRLDLVFEDGTRLAVEKNEVINMYENPKKLKGGEQKEIISIPPELTLNKMLEEGQKIQGKKWFRYSAYNNNCQDFIIALVNGSNIGDQQDREFIKQNTESLFKGDSFLRKFANTVTDIGGKVNEITTGAGLDNESEIQSIVFNKDSWTKKKAINWLKKHNYEGLDCDEKENTLRFRQNEPNKNYKYITKSLPNEIELIITYKNKISNNKYNKMGKSKKHITYDSDSSDSDSDMEGRGIKREKRIIRKMKDLSDEIDEHHKVHGGKINIGRAFKKLGSTIKKGFESKISKPLVHDFTRDIIKPSEKALVPLANKAGDYITAKKGGLASDIITYGIPAASSAVLGGLATLATGGNPVAGVAASALGSKLGAMGASELKKSTGTGVKRRGRPSKHMNDLVHIDIGSHNAKGDIEGGKIRRTRNTSLEQMIESHRAKEKDELMDALRVMASNINKEKKPPKAPKYSKALGSGISGCGKFKKGSLKKQKTIWLRIRAMKGKK